MLKLLKFLSLLNIYYCHTYVGCSNLMLAPTRPGIFSSVIIASRVQISTFLKRLCILHALTHTAMRCVGQQWPVCPCRQVKLKLTPTGVNQCCFNSIRGSKHIFFFFLPSLCLWIRQLEVLSEQQRVQTLLISLWVRGTDSILLFYSPDV